MIRHCVCGRAVIGIFARCLACQPTVERLPIRKPVVKPVSTPKTQVLCTNQSET